MLGLIAVYALCGATGLALERRLHLNSLLKRAIAVLLGAMAQLMLSLQILSLPRWLTGPRLLVANLLLTGLALAISSRMRPPQGRISWRVLSIRAREELAAHRPDILLVALTSVAFSFFVLSTVAGWLMLPLGDAYHFEMPLFWTQNRSLLPFPVHNPRIVAFSFLTEAMALPGFVYLRSPSMAAVFTLIGGLLCLWVIFSLARRIGANFTASACAAGVAVGCTTFALDPLVAAAHSFFAGGLFGASLLFLMDLRARGTTPTAGHSADLGLSVFSFLMACGAKNSTVLLAPLYLPALALCLKHAFVSERTSGPPRPETAHATRRRFSRTALTICLAGATGLACSGVAWNYVSNKVWFGDTRGPEFLREHLSRDHRPRAVWTRMCRGAILLAYDVIWIPKTANARYAALCEGTARALGAQNELAEDDHYYSFKPEKLAPRKGLGLVGIFLFVPGVALAIFRLASQRHSKSTRYPPARFAIGLLVVSTLAAFFMSHLVLRWQSIGILRLMFPFIVVGAPLCALLLERPRPRIAGLVVLIGSSAMFSTFLLGHVGRRMGWSHIPPFNVIARIQNEHTLSATYQWEGRPAGAMAIKEDYTLREAYGKLIEGLEQPSTIGFIGSTNSECGYLFGRRFQNRVVPLVDSRSPRQLLVAPWGLDYVVAVDRFEDASRWAKENGFRRCFAVATPNGEILVAFAKRSARGPGLASASSR